MRMQRNVRMMKKQKGIAIMDIAIALTIFGLGSLFVVKGVPAIMHEIKMMSVRADVTDIQNAAKKWKGGRSNFSGVHIATQLCASNYLSDSLCGPAGDGVASNPWGGNYTVTVNTANVSRIDVGITSIDSTRIQQVADALAPATAEGCTAAGVLGADCDSVTGSGTTLTLTY